MTTGSSTRPPSSSTTVNASPSGARCTSGSSAGAARPTPSTVPVGVSTPVLVRAARSRLVHDLGERGLVRDAGDQDRHVAGLLVRGRHRPVLGDGAHQQAERAPRTTPPPWTWSARTSHEIRRRISPGSRGSTRRTPTPRTTVQVARLGRGLAQLATQPRQVDVDGALGAAVRLLPDVGQQLPLRDHLARPRGQREQQVELLAGQLQRLAREGRRAGALVDDQVADPDRLRRRSRAPPDRRSTARIRAASWSVPNGLTT